MTLRFTVLGYELARVELDIVQLDQPATVVHNVVEASIKNVSRRWVSWMAR